MWCYRYNGFSSGKIFVKVHTNLLSIKFGCSEIMNFFAFCFELINALAICLYTGNTQAGEAIKIYAGKCIVLDIIRGFIKYEPKMHVVPCALFRTGNFIVILSFEFVKSRF